MARSPARTRCSADHGTARILAILAMTALVSVQGLAVLASYGPAGGPPDIGPESVAERYPLWIDFLDDVNHVYVPPTGLAGVEVADGEARLASGKSEGWFASSIISCPVGYRYDFVWIEAEAPGNSYVEVSLLDSTEESTVVGFANETIPGFVRMRSTEASVYDVDPDTYPHVRIQVDLHADGDDRPRVLGWALYFVGEEEWMDDFVGTGKMTDSRGIVLDGGQVSLDFSRKGASGGQIEYPKYPTVVVMTSGPTSYLPVFYANAAGTGYSDVTTISTNQTYNVAFDDLDYDGQLDLLLANYYSTTVYPAEIWWGQSSGVISSSGCTMLPTYRNYDVETGDFNGDGIVDFVMSTYDGTHNSVVFFGDGTRDFPTTPDVSFNALYNYNVDTGDLNGDGFDDIVFYYSDGSYYYLKCHFGSSTGPDTTADVSIGPNRLNWFCVEDIDNDGYADIVTATRVTQQDIYLGGPSGPDSTADYTLSATNGYGWRCAVGDINGDNLRDLVFLTNNIINVFEGTSSGWSDSVRHDISVGSTTTALFVTDMDKDGYDDIYVGVSNYLWVYEGSASWSLTRVVQKSSSIGINDISVAVPKGPTARNYTGHFITKRITLPPGKKWDVLDLSARMEPNTTLRITVLDDIYRRPISGFDNLTVWNLDISGLSRNVIYVRVDITSELNTTSPWLDRLTVTWIDEMCWMDRFYGMARVDRLFGLTVSGGMLVRPPGAGFGPTIVLPSLTGDAGEAPMSLAFTDSGSLSYVDNPPIELGAKGAYAVDSADVDGDGLMDLVFAVYRTGASFSAKSPLYLGSAVGWSDSPDHTFPTVGARDVLLRDLNGDGCVDVVFAQETDGTTYSHPSVLFWGSASGFNSTADVTFSTTGATDVEAADIDGDGRLDLVFACGRSASSACDSMVFLQGPTGFDGSSPSHRLPTQSACAVDVGDLDGNGRSDVVFANNFSTGMVEIDSFIYWGRTGGGFDTTPTGVRTVGASDVAIADVDGDGDLDLAFANCINNQGRYEVDSYVYLNGGAGAFGTQPDARLPTTGASAVMATDLDGKGWMDLVFACHRNLTSHSQDSLVYLGGASGYGSVADARLPTGGASDVVAIPMAPGRGGYLSEPITPEEPDDVGGYNTLSYMATLGPSHDASLAIIDDSTWEVIATERLLSGMHEWRVAGLFRYAEHQTVRVAVIATGLDSPGDLSVDNLRLNWTKRTPMPPSVHGIDVSETQVLRGHQVTLVLNVSDEFDLPSGLRVGMEHRRAGGAWQGYLLGTPTYGDGVWKATFRPRLDSDVGWYDIRAWAVDSDESFSGYSEFPSLVKVLNNLPAAPGVRILPAPSYTDSSLRVELTSSSSDVESNQLSYRYRWYVDGMPVDSLTTDNVPPSCTVRGQNWSVEVRAYDGLDEGPPGVAWTVVQNSAPRVGAPLEPLTMEEDAVDATSIVLANAFVDADGDPVSWGLATAPKHLAVAIDPATGSVRVAPEADWFGIEELVFVGSDGELEARQSVIVTVQPVNDPPRFSSIDGQPIVGTPVRLTVMEDEPMTVLIDAFDVEGSELRFSCNLSRFEIDIRTGDLSFTPNNDDVGTIHLSVTVWEVAHPDTASILDFVIVVVNVNDPLDTPRIHSPAKGSLFREDQTIHFQGSCDDPDVHNGQVLNYTWSSDISGILGYGSMFTLTGLAPGNHTITLTVRDSEFIKSASVPIDVEAVGGGPVDGPEDGPSVSHGPSALLLLVVILVIVVIVADIYIVAARRRRSRPSPIEESETSRREPLEVTVPASPPPPAAAGGLVLEEVSPGTMVWRQSTAPAPSAPTGAPTAATVAPYRPPPPPPSAPTPPPAAPTVTSPPTPSPPSTLHIPPAGPPAPTSTPGVGPDLSIPGMDAEEAALAREEREVMRALTQLPQGLPTTFWGWDMVALARAILSGERKTLPDGTEVVNIEGRWYNADRTNVGRFLREHKEPEEPKRTPRPAEDRAERLDMLERALLEGKVSEETYKELKAKYEK